jgi:hypothetical protein
VHKRVLLCSYKELKQDSENSYATLMMMITIGQACLSGML